MQKETYSYHSNLFTNCVNSLTGNVSISNVLDMAQPNRKQIGSIKWNAKIYQYVTHCTIYIYYLCFKHSTIGCMMKTEETKTLSNNSKIQ